MWIIPDIYGQANGSSNNASINNGYNGNASQSQYGQTPAPPVAPPPPPFNGGKFHAKGFIYFVYFFLFITYPAIHGSKLRTCWSRTKYDMNSAHGTASRL